MRDLRDQVKAFLRGKARDNADHRQIDGNAFHAELAQQVIFAFFFALKIFRRVLPRKMLVALRAPLVVVHAVQNPAQRACTRLQYAFQAKAIFAGLNLLRIFTADGSDVVRKNQRALQKVGLAPELHLVDGEEVPRKHEQRQRVRRKQSLITDVVDGEHGARAAEDRISLVAGAQQNRHQRRLPVMAMKNVGYTQDLGSFQHGAAIEGEALGVIGIIARRGAVKGIAIEKRRIVNKEEWN